ncbi:MAG: hypothetical protein IK007_05615 [Lachnospiraceae bacterium]|nr:hypothetical protein [Lachnospiraceae bacterium]
MFDNIFIPLLLFGLAIVLLLVIYIQLAKNKKRYVKSLVVVAIGILMCASSLFIKYLKNQTEYNKAINYAIKDVDSLNRYSIDVQYNESKRSIEYCIKCQNGAFFSIASAYKEYLFKHKDSLLNDNYSISIKFEDRAGDYIIIRNDNVDGVIQDGFHYAILEGDYDDILFGKLMDDEKRLDIYELTIRDWKSLDKNLSILKIFPSLESIYIDVRNKEEYNNLKKRINNFLPQCVVVNLYEKNLMEISTVSQITYGNKERIDCFLYVKEGENYAKYWVLPTNNYGDSVLLLRYFELKEEIYYNDARVDSYGTYYNGCNLDSFLDKIFYKRYSVEVQSIINNSPVVIHSLEYIKNPNCRKEESTEIIYRHVFSLSKSEWDSKSYEKENQEGTFIDALKGIYYSNVWLRTEENDPNVSDRVVILDDYGFSSKKISETAYVQPAFTVKPDTEIKLSDSVIQGEKVFVFAVE